MFKKYLLFSLLFALYCDCSAITTKCNLRQYKYGGVCVCTKESCDFLENPTPSDPNEYVIISTSKAGLRFATSTGRFESQAERVKSSELRKRERDRDAKTFEHIALVVENRTAFLQFPAKEKQRQLKLSVDREQKYQKIVSFGGAFTGSVSHVLAQLEPELQDQVFRSYFHKDGINYNSVRMPIGGCDFDLAPWAYNELPRDDEQLSNFTRLDASDLRKVAQIQRLKQVAELDELKIMAAAWSPPRWMKSAEDWTGFSLLQPKYYQTWADYHLRFIELMDAQGLPIWAISTGNEPLNGVIGMILVRFMSLGWIPSNQAIWLSGNLGPTIRNSKYKNVLIFGNDDQRYTYPDWFRKMKATRSNSLDYLDGLAVHWYWDYAFGPQLIDEAHRDMPDKLIMNTEACVGDKPWQRHGPELGSWRRAEQYMSAIMQDTQHAFNGWLDWNLVLDEQGGPNYVRNYVDAPIIVNTTSRTEFYKQPMFYAQGHFSKFVPEGSVRIATTTTTSGAETRIDSVGFLRPDGRIALVIFNAGNSKVRLALSDSQRGAGTLDIPARSWHTIIYE